MREKIDVVMKSPLPFAALASVLFHLFIIASPYFTHNVMRPKRIGSWPDGAVIKITLGSVSSPMLATADRALQTVPDVSNVLTFISEPVNAVVPDSTVVEANTSSETMTRGGLKAPQPTPPLVAYYPIEQLTKRPQPTATVQLDAPEISPLIASGRIVMKLWINEWGGVNDAIVEKSSLPPKFSESAVNAMKQLKFIPGEFYGRRVPVLMKIEISYDDFRVPPL